MGAKKSGEVRRSLKLQAGDFFLVGSVVAQKSGEVRRSLKLGSVGLYGVIEDVMRRRAERYVAH